MIAGTFNIDSYACLQVDSSAIGWSAAVSVMPAIRSCLPYPRRRSPTRRSTNPSGAGTSAIAARIARPYAVLTIALPRSSAASWVMKPCREAISSRQAIWMP